ncbi:MAG: hypothetical protein HQK76_08740 [Desulfobacterales bacterium]|nr:hypothetical protein [Desulfobacterales bacterium]
MINNKFFIIGIFFFFLFFTSCGHINKWCGLEEYDLPYDKDAQIVLSNLADINHDLTSFKGLGKIRLYSNGNFLAYRIALAASGKESLRIEVLNPLGHPVISLSSNETALYFLSHGNNYTFKKLSRNTRFDKFIDVPISSNELIGILEARPYIYPHDIGILSKIDNGYVLTLKKKWKGIVQKIYLDETKSNLNKIEYFTNKKILYSVIFKKMENQDGYIVPTKVFILSDSGELEIEIYKLYINISIDESIFTLKPPG